MPPMNETPREQTGMVIKVYYAVIILFLILSVAAIYFYSSEISGTTTDTNATTTENNVPLSDLEKSEVLDQLSEGAVATTSMKSKLQTLNQLQKQKSPSTLTDSDKLKLLESLK